MEKLTAWQSTRDTNFVGSSDLIVGADKDDKPIFRDRIVTIDYVNAEEEVMDTQTSKKVKKSVAHFKEKDIKPMILNTTNKQGIEQATGTIFLEKWAGKQILLTVQQIKAFGKTQPALRIKPVPRRVCDICGKEIDEQTYQGSMLKYGMALCSKECGVKAGKIKESE